MLPEISPDARRVEEVEEGGWEGWVGWEDWEGLAAEDQWSSLQTYPVKARCFVAGI